MKKIIYGLTFIFLICLVYGANNWVNDPTSCPATDETNFPGQDCVANVICGDDAGNAVCNASEIVSPGSNGVSETSCDDGTNNGGYVVNCYATADGSDPECSDSICCDRNSSCYNSPVYRKTNCTASTFGVTLCGVCRTSRYNCFGDTNCESTSTSACEQGGDNNHYTTATCDDGTGGGTCVCDANAQACDTVIDDADGCEILNGSSCGSSTGTYAGCNATIGHCTSATNSDCNDDDGDADLTTCNGGGGSPDYCEITGGGSCGSSTGTYVNSECTNSTHGNCTATGVNLDCDDDDDDGNLLTCNGLNACEVENGGACSVGTLSGTYSSCTCIVDKGHFITGNLTQYSTNSTECGLLCGEDFGTSDKPLLNISNNNLGAFLLINSSGCIIFPDLTSLCSVSEINLTDNDIWFENQTSNFVEINDSNTNGVSSISVDDIVSTGLFLKEGCVNFQDGSIVCNMTDISSQVNPENFSVNFSQFTNQSNINFIQNCSGDGTCENIFYQGHNLNCSNIDNATSDLCTIEDTQIGNCSGDGSCGKIAYETGANFTGNIDLAGYNLTNVLKLSSIDGSFLGFGSDPTFDGLGQAGVIASNQTLGPGVITFAILDTQGMKVIAAWQVGKNNSWHFNRNSMGVFGDLGGTNASNLTDSIKMWNSIGINPEFDYDTPNQGASLGVQYGIETRKIRIHDTLDDGDFNGEGLFRWIVREGDDFDIYEGPVHIQDLRIEEITTGIGPITLFDITWDGESTAQQPPPPFNVSGDDVGNSINEWSTRNDARCNSNPCARAKGGDGSAIRGIDYNFTTSNIFNINLSFYYGSKAMTAGAQDNFSVYMNNNSGSGFILIWNDTITNADINPPIFKNFSVPQIMENISVVTLRFFHYATTTNKESYIDNVKINGTAGSPTLQNITRFDGKIEFGDGDCNIQVNGSDNTMTLGGAGCGDIVFTGNTSFESVTITDLNTTGNFTVNGTLTANNILSLGWIKASNWLNVSITESQISNLAHVGNCSGDQSCANILYTTDLDVVVTSIGNWSSDKSDYWNWTNLLDKQNFTVCSEFEVMKIDSGSWDCKYAVSDNSCGAGEFYDGFSFGSPECGTANYIGNCSVKGNCNNLFYSNHSNSGNLTISVGDFNLSDNLFHGNIFQNGTHTCWDYPTLNHCTFLNGTRLITT